MDEIKIQPTLSSRRLWTLLAIAGLLLLVGGILSIAINAFRQDKTLHALHAVVFEQVPGGIGGFPGAPFGTFIDASLNPVFKPIQKLVDKDGNEKCRWLLGKPRSAMILNAKGKFQDADVENLIKLTTIEELWLDADGLTDAGILRLKELPQLEQLSINSYGLRRISVKAISELKTALPGLNVNY